MFIAISLNNMAYGNKLVMDTQQQLKGNVKETVRSDWRENEVKKYKLDEEF